MTLDAAPPSRRERLHAVLLAALCAVLFLGKSLVPGQALVPYPPEYYDVPYEQAAAAGGVDLAEIGRGNVSMGDKYGQSLAWDRILQSELRRGQTPRWNREIGGGVRFVPQQMGQPFEPINLLLLLLPSAEWYGWSIFVHLVLLGAFAYGFVRRLGCAHGSGLFAVVLATLGLWTQSKVHHNVMYSAAVALFPMLSAVHDLARRDGGVRSAAWLALWTGIAWLSGFVVIALQECYLVGGYALLIALGNARGRRLQPLLWTGVGFAAGFALATAQVAPLVAALPDSARPPALDAAQHRLRSLDWDYLLTFAWPDLFHWAGDVFYAKVDPALPLAVRPPLSQLVLLRDPTGAAGNWVECAVSMSLPACAAALLALRDAGRRGVVVLFAVIAVLGFGMATATPPCFGLARALPGLAATDVRRQLWFAAMALVVLGALGAERLRAGQGLLGARALLAAIAAVSAAAWLWLLGASDDSLAQWVARGIAADQGHPLVQGHSLAEIEAWVRGTVYPGELAANLDHLRTTMLRALLVAAAAFGASFAPRPAWRLGIWTAAAAFELLHAGAGPVQTVASTRVTTPPRVVAPVLAAADDASGVRPRFQRLGPRDEVRFASGYLPNLPAFHGIEDTAAYSSLPPRRQEEFFRALEPDAPGKTTLVPGGTGVAWFHDPASLQHPLADLFGIRFVLTDQRDVAAGNLVDRTPTGCGRFRLLERTSVLPRATFVRNVDLLPDPAARLAALARRDRDVARRVILEEPDAPMPTPSDDAPPATVQVVRHADERVELRVQTEVDGYVRLADAWDRGWRAAVDGAPARIWIADHYLRAVHVGPGEHSIVFTFDAADVVWPPRITLAVYVLLCAVLLRRPARTNAAVSARASR